MCGIVGLATKKVDAISGTVFGMFNLQHRGEQLCGVAASDGVTFNHHTAKGLVTEVFNDQDREALYQKLKGRAAIGQVLYSTRGRDGDKKQIITKQPLVGEFHGVNFAVGHNGNLIGLDPLREKAKLAGYCFASEDSDTEVIVALLATSTETDFEKALFSILPQLKGSFALAILYKDKVIGVRDSNGIKPLCLGYNSWCWMLASEDCAFPTLGVDFVRELRPGEMVVLGQDGVHQCSMWTGNTKLAFDIFEFVYFARPDSTFCGRPVWSYRDAAGRTTAREQPIKADIIMGVPESGRIYGEAFADEANIPHVQGLYRNRYFTTRSFLTVSETDRRGMQRRKIHTLKSVLAGRRVVLVEDSFVRGSVIPETVSMVREARAAEVHVRVCSAPVCSICYLGMDFSDISTLPAARMNHEELNAALVHADSFGFLSGAGMVAATGMARENFCMGCFNGEYPVALPAGK